MISNDWNASLLLWALAGIFGRLGHFVVAAFSSGMVAHNLLYYQKYIRFSDNLVIEDLYKPS